MKALTVCAGWAELIFHAQHPKDIENRSWATSHRGPLLIHAGKSKKEIEYARDYCDYIGVSFAEPSIFGAIIGTVDVVGCDRISESRWAVPDHFHWRLKNPRLFPDPIACNGSLSLWTPSIEVRDKVEEHLRRNTNERSNRPHDQRPQRVPRPISEETRAFIHHGGQRDGGTGGV